MPINNYNARQTAMRNIRWCCSSKEEGILLFSLNATEMEIMAPIFAFEPIDPHTVGSFKTMILHGMRREDV